MAGTKGRSGGFRDGAGRPPKNAFRADPGAYIVFQQEKIGGVPDLDRLGQVLSCTADEVKIQINSTIYVIRLPFKGEIGLVKE